MNIANERLESETNELYGARGLADYLITVVNVYDNDKKISTRIVEEKENDHGK